MALARAQICRVSKRMCSSISIIPHPPPPPPHPKITEDKFSFLDAVEGKSWPANHGYPINLYQFYIKRSLLKGATQEEKMNFYIKTAAQVIGSEEEAKDRIRMITYDCSLDGFGLEISTDVAYKIVGLESIEKKVDVPYAGMVPFGDRELIHWSLIPKKREKGRFPLPKPDLDISGRDDDDSVILRNMMEYD